VSGQVAEALDQLWADVCAGSPQVVRLARSTEEVAAWVGARPATARVGRWSGRALPDMGPPRVVWFHGGPGVRATADVVTSTVWLLDLPWLVLLSGDTGDAGPALGVELAPAGQQVVSEHSAVVDTPLVRAPDEVGALQRGLATAAHHGRWVEAAGWHERLAALDPAAAMASRWTIPARAHALSRPDLLSAARAAAQQEGPGHAELLAWSALLMPLRQRERLLLAAVSRAETPSQRADLQYRFDRTRMSYGAVAARNLRWPGSVPLTAEMLYFQVEKLQQGTAERASLEQEIHDLDCELGEVLLAVAARGVDDTALPQWVELARAHLRRGDLRQAAFDLSGKVMAPGPEPLRERVMRGVGRFPGRFADLPRLDAAVAAGDWATARRLARAVQGREPEGGFLTVVMEITERVADAVLDGDPRGLVRGDGDALREYLQPAFPELVQAGVAAAPPGVQQRLRWLAARWWRQLGDPRAAEAEAALVEGAVGEVSVPIGAYEAVECVGRGGMGEVWRGRHVGLDVPVAIKLLRSHRDRALFLEEVELTAQLDHEAIVHVHDAGVVSPETAAASRNRWPVGTPYLVMEFVADGTLATLREPLDAPQVRAILLAILDALAHAHARGVVHRDLKPENVLVARTSEGLKIRLSDFGLAAVEAGRVSGTPTYMAPEQFGRGEVGPAADLYALGCVATYLVTGSPPFAGSVRQLAMAHRFEPPPELEVAGLPDGFDRWRRRLLHKDPAQRYPSAWAAFQALDALDDAGATWASPVSGAEETFVFGTMTGLIPGAESRIWAPQITAEIEVGSVEPVPGGLVDAPLPDSGFRSRSARPRMPTTRLFARREPPRVGHHDAREALWQAAREALQGPSAVGRVVRVAEGVALEPLVHDLVLRLRELGLDAGDDARAEVVVRTGGPVEPAPSLRLEAVRRGPADVVVDLLPHVEIVAWLQAQVHLDPDLAWELARRAMGSTELAGALLDEVLHRAVHATPRGLALSRPLEPVLDAERARWSERLRRLPAATRDHLRWAAVLVPGFPGSLLEALAGPQAVASLAGRARQVRGRWTLAAGLRQLAREQLRDLGDLARRHAVAAERCEGPRQALHRLAAGDPQALVQLMEVLRGRMGAERPPDRDLLDGVELALDLDLSPPGSVARSWCALGWARRAQALGRGAQAREGYEALRHRDDEVGVRAERRSWALRPPEEVLAAADHAVARARRWVGEGLACELRLEQGRALARAGRLADAMAHVRAVPWAQAAPDARALGRLVSAELAAAGGAVAEAVDMLTDLPADDTGAALELVRSALREQLGDRRGARADAMEVARRSRGPVFVRAATRVARLALVDGDLDVALRWSVAGLDFLVGTAWPEPRRQLEAVRLAATAHQPGDEWELLWLAHGHRGEVGGEGPRVAWGSPTGGAAAIAASGADRAEAAGLTDRARRLRALYAAPQPRKG